jgi:hypothetical protein
MDGSRGGGAGGSTRWRLNVNVRVDDPSVAEVDYYVGLEHLDSDSLKIRRWGSPSPT